MDWTVLIVVLRGMSGSLLFLLIIDHRGIIQAFNHAAEKLFVTTASRAHFARMTIIAGIGTSTYSAPDGFHYAVW